MQGPRSPMAGPRSPFGARRSPALFTVSIGSGNVISGTELTASITPDPAPATPTYQWTRGGTNITGATSATYTPAIGTDSVADLSLIRCVVTIDGEPYTSNARQIVYAAPTFSAQPQITGTPTIGQTLTLVEGAAGPNATLEIVTFTLAGVDKTGELVGLDWDTTGESPGEIALRVSATNSGGTTLSNIITVNLLASVNPTITSFSVTERAGGQRDLLNLAVNKNGSTDTTHVLGIVTRNGGTQLTGAQIKAGTGTFLERVVLDPLPAGTEIDLSGFTATSNGDRNIDVAVWEKNNGGVSDSATDNIIGANFTAPTATWATSTDGTQVIGTVSKNIYGTEAAGNWTVPGHTVSTVTISGTTITLAITSAIENGDVDTVSYSGGDLVGEDGNALATISGASITNEVSAGYGTDFVMEIETTGASETFAIVNYPFSPFNATVDWGDGGATSSITAPNDADLTHVYASPGLYLIRISGVFPNIRFDTNTTHRGKVRRVLQLGDVGWRTLANGFNGCANMTEFTAGTTDTSLITDFTGFLTNCTSMTSCDLTGLSTTAATSLSNMFSSCSALTSLDVSGFDMNGVTSVSQMFQNMGPVDIVGMDTWDVSTITNGFIAFGSTVIPTARYDALLIAWDAQTVTSGAAWTFSSTKYTAGGAAEAARSSLITNDSWSFIDGGPA